MRWVVVGILALAFACLLRPHAEQTGRAARVRAPLRVVPPTVRAEAREPIAQEPAAAEAAGEEEAVVEVCQPTTLMHLLSVQNEDGSWGGADEVVGSKSYGREGATALALLAFMGAGYSHLSKDTHRGIEVGPAIRRGLEWLQRNMPADTFNMTLAALALSEAYGLTGSQRWKDGAMDAVRHVAQAQDGAGGWGDTETSTWGGWVLASARLSDIPGYEPYEARAAAYFADVAPWDPAVLGAWALADRKKTPDKVEAAERLAASAPAWGDFSRLYRAANGLFQADGPDGPRWREWSATLR